MNSRDIYSMNYRDIIREKQAEIDKRGITSEGVEI